MTTQVSQELLARQLEYEQALIDGGIDRYKKALDKAKAKGHYGESMPGAWVIEGCFPKLVSQIEHRVEEGLKGTAGWKNSILKYLQLVPEEKLAYITLRILIDSTANHKVEKTAVARRIGFAIEEELEYITMEKDREKSRAFKYWTEKARQATHPVTKDRCMAKLKSLFDPKIFQKITHEDKICMGVACIEDAKTAGQIVSEVVERRGYKTISYLVLADYFVEEMGKFNKRVESLWPIFEPMLVPPKAWEGSFHGGFIGALGQRTKLVRTPNRRYLEDLNLSRDRLGKVFKALNAIQSTPWRINKRVFDIMNEVHMHDWNAAYGLARSWDEPFPPTPLDMDTNSTSKQAFALEIQKAQDFNKMNRGHYISLGRMLAAAEKFRDESAIYFPHNLDWRGRIYPIASHISPQGDELSRSLLEFAKGKPLGSKEAVGWLAIYGSGCFGYDKVSFEERIAWVKEHQEHIKATTEEPLDYRWWLQADNPWMFLAFCFEWVGYLKDGLDFVSHLPISMDGSCNGLQNFAAMLRHPETAKAVNLAPGDKPNDIYQQVGAIVARKVHALAILSTDSTEALLAYAKDRTQREINFQKAVEQAKEAADARPEKGRQKKDTSEYEAYQRLRTEADDAKRETGELWNILGARWIDGQISRALVKRPVMTYPYAVTEEGVKRQLTGVLRELHRAGKMKFPYEHASKIAFMLKGLVYETVREEVWAAARAMDWLKHVAEEISKHNRPVSWFSPIGLLVVQEYKATKDVQVDTVVGGVRVRSKIPIEQMNIDPRRQISAIAPNFVHSCDASHLMMTVNACVDKGISNFHMIHDSYGTHACNAGALALTLREEFVRIYSGNVLQDFRDNLSMFLADGALGGLTPPPKQGNFDLNEVLKSKYFFI